jgi:hypothetical protein
MIGNPFGQLAFANSLSEFDPRFETLLREAAVQHHLPAIHQLGSVLLNKHLFDEARTIFQMGVMLQDPHCEVWFAGLQPRGTPFAIISCALFHAATSGNSDIHLLLGQYFEDTGEIKNALDSFKRSSDLKTPMASFKLALR